MGRKRIDLLADETLLRRMLAGTPTDAELRSGYVKDATFRKRVSRDAKASAQPTKHRRNLAPFLRLGVWTPSDVDTSTSSTTWADIADIAMHEAAAACGSLAICYYTTPLPELRLLHINPQGEQIYRIRNNDVVGMTLWDIMANLDFSLMNASLGDYHRERSIILDTVCEMASWFGPVEDERVASITEKYSNFLSELSRIHGFKRKSSDNRALFAITGVYDLLLVDSDIRRKFSIHYLLADAILSSTPGFPDIDGVLAFNERWSLRQNWRVFESLSIPDTVRTWRRMEGVRASLVRDYPSVSAPFSLRTSSLA